MGLPTFLRKPGARFTEQADPGSLSAWNPGPSAQIAVERQGLFRASKTGFPQRCRMNPLYLPCSYNILPPRFVVKENLGIAAMFSIS